MKKGTIVYFKVNYGFVLDDESETQYFFYITNVVDGFVPAVGKRVSFQTAPPIRLGQKDQAVSVGAE